MNVKAAPASADGTTAAYKREKSRLADMEHAASDTKDAIGKLQAHLELAFDKIAAQDKQIEELRREYTRLSDYHHKAAKQFNKRLESLGLS